MPDQNSNTETQSVPPVSTGPTVEELQAKVAELEKAREGLIRDVQHERSKRQELESSSSPASPAVNTGEKDELGQLINPYIERKNQEILNRYYNDKAMDFLASKTGKTVDQVMADIELQNKLISTARKWGLAGNTYDVAVKAMQLMELESARSKYEESNRNTTETLPKGNPPNQNTGSHKFSNQEFRNMPVAQFDELSSKGSFRKLEDGSFEYIAR